METKVFSDTNEQGMQDNYKDSFFLELYPL